MTTTLTYMKGEEFVRKVVEGERDFSGIELEKGLDLHNVEGYSEMHEYLFRQDYEKKDLKQNPIRINGSSFMYINANSLHMPYLIAEGANLRGTRLVGANLLRANLERANLATAELQDSYLLGANLSRANLWGAHLERADLEGANLRGTNFSVATLWATSFKNVKNLRSAKHLDLANCINLCVTPKERKIIKRLLVGRETFLDD